MSINPLHERIKAAFWVCSLDGTKYGKRQLTKVPRFLHGWCDICETHKQVTEFQKYGYFKKNLSL